jgi:fructose-1,6-bisphosphatase/inositol monophosphatase family enzyme
MHPSNNLLLPILRKHGDRLLKAQVEAMVKELSWQEQDKFLKQQLEASTQDIREKLARSYPNSPFLVEWQPEVLKSSLKAWVFALSGEQNYLNGLDDFTLAAIAVELGKPYSLIAYSPATATEFLINSDKQITKNNYRINKKPRGPEGQIALERITNNPIQDFFTILGTNGTTKIRMPKSWITHVLVQLSDYPLS